MPFFFSLQKFVNCFQKKVDRGVKCFIEVAIFDDGLQDKILDYNITFVCFNIQTWVGNSFCIPSGPLREDLKSIKKYDAVFLNGNGENTNG